VIAPVRVFDAQEAVRTAFEAGELNRDVVIPVLGNLQDAGYKVALVTDGRMSGASGKVPAAIHVAPEAARGGPLAKLRDGDVVELDAVANTLDVQVSPEEFAAREAKAFLPNVQASGLGQDLFDTFRAQASGADAGASFFTFSGREG